MRAKRCNSCHELCLAARTIIIYLLGQLVTRYSDATEPSDNLVKLFESSIGDANLPTLFPSVSHLNFQAQGIGKPCLEVPGFGVLGVAPGAPHALAFRALLGFANIEHSRNDVLGAFLCVWQPDQSSGMTGGQLSVANQGANGFRQGQESQCVRDMAAAFADFLRHLLLREFEPLHEFVIGGGFFNGVEICALNIFDDGDFERLGVVHVAYDDRHLVELRHLRGAPAPFAGDDFIGIGLAANRARQNRLQHALLSDGIGKIVELVRREALARLQFVRAQKRDRKSVRGTRCRGLAARWNGFLADQRREAAAQSTRTFFRCHYAAACSRSRAINSPASLMYAWLPG